MDVTEPRTRAAVALGSNLGDRLETLNGALRQLRDICTIVAVSSLYETAPIGGPEQSSFYNAVVLVDTMLGPEDLVAALHQIEATFDRTREVRWGPRTLDLDLILYGDVQIETDTLIVPHPRYRERRFVLEPLLEVWGEAVDPDGTVLEGQRRAVADQEIVKLDESHWNASSPSPGRGGGWVLGQILVLGVVFAITIATAGQIEVAMFDVAGGVLAAIGGIVLVVALTDLGRMTTPFPEPIGAGGLVGSGVYGVVRHPMYVAVMLIALGLAGFAGSSGGVAAWPALVAFFVAKAAHEEKRLGAVYPGYEAYRQRVRGRFVPRPTRPPEAST